MLAFPLTQQPISFVGDPTGTAAVSGEVGLEEGWHIARDVLGADAHAQVKPSDRRSRGCARAGPTATARTHWHPPTFAGAADANATACLAGHPVIAVAVGNAISGAFLSHGFQANRIVAPGRRRVSCWPRRAE
jgi:hypothetical protein